MGAEDGERGRYTAFLSYSHKDAAQARRLHRRLERYRIPARLVGTAGRHGPVPARLTPIFRDREELPAAGDLSATVRDALAASDHLIILCSPNAAASLWVEREIAAFRELRPGRPVLAAILDGEPGDCFPAALVADGAEPLAADLRRAGDGRQLGFLKLVAALAGLDLDALVQRDAARRMRSVMAVTLVAFVALLAMAVLLFLAINARRESERRRGEAEGLVEFMLTDLRTKLKGVGRVDVLATVNRRALDYYAHQPSLDALPADSLERRARVLHAMGEDEETRGDLAAAERRFKEAGRTTATLLARAPNDTDRIFAQSQSEFWLGSVAYARHQTAKARGAFQRYKMLADRLVARDPGKPNWVKEAGFAEGSLCSVAMEPPADQQAALSACRAALVHMEHAARLLHDGSVDLDLVNRHMWLAGIYAGLGDHAAEAHHLSEQERLLAPLIARDPRNQDYQDMWLVLQMSLARHEIAVGDNAAYPRLTKARERSNAMVRADPENRQWAERRSQIDRLLMNNQE
ncbi:MAG TPA: toll/interleukin-1 receptor domain-containing protein [Sphingomonas sp.]|nr:toll/interleukin-1 receptor domain-containing protein [Sphingomonas sp.]